MASVKRRRPADQLRRMPHHPVSECRRCRQTVPICGRGLCDACWQAAKKDGTLIDYPTTHQRLSAAELVEEYEVLASGGCDYKEIARRLGYSNPYYARRRYKHLRQVAS